MGPNTGNGGSDVSVLSGAGVAAASLVQDGTDYFDLHHTPDDTLDKVSAELLDQNVAAYVVTTYVAAEWEGRFK